MNTTLKWMSSLAIATALYATSFSSGAADLPRNEAPSRLVKAWDLDLAQRDDVQTLYQRVQAAARDLCEDEERSLLRSTRRRPSSHWTEQCVSDAVDAAIRSARDQRLAAVHEGATRRLVVLR